MCCSHMSRFPSNYGMLTDRENAYPTLISDTWSVIWPSTLAVPKISRRSFPAHSSPTFPASSRIWRIACSPTSPEGTSRQCRIISDQFKTERRVNKEQACLIPGWAFGSLSQFLAMSIFELISPRALFMASVSFVVKRQIKEKMKREW